MIKKYSYKNVEWIDMEKPSEDEVSQVVGDYKLNPIIGEELANYSLKSKFEVHKDHAFTVLHFPVRVSLPKKHQIKVKEIDFVISKNFIITARYDTIEPLHNFSKMFETNSVLDKESSTLDGSLVFYYMLRAIYKKIDEDLESLKDEIVNIESQIFEGKEKDMVKKISFVAREIIDLRQTIKPHKELLEALETEANKNSFGSEFIRLASDLKEIFNKINLDSQDNRELLNDLRSTNDSLLSAKQNEVMKTFTIMAFTTFPLSLFVAVFSLETTHTPILGNRFDFEIIVGIIIVAILIMLLVFNKKKWI